MKPIDDVGRKDTRQMREHDQSGKAHVLVIVDGTQGCLPALEVPAPDDTVHFDVRTVSDLRGLEKVVLDLSPHVVLVDMCWLERCGTTAIQASQRSHASVPWLVVCASDSPKNYALLACSHSMGCVDRAIDRPGLMRALTSVLRGECWFSRTEMQQLYWTLLRWHQDDEEAKVDKTLDLSTRQAQSLLLMRQGLSNKQIAARLGVSVNTVKKHVEIVFDRAGVRSRRQLIDCSGTQPKDGATHPSGPLCPRFGAPIVTNMKKWAP